MAVKDDYVMRMIKDMARVLARLILGKDDINYVLPEDEEFTVIDNLYKKLITMADAGQINEAENILLNELEDKSSEYFEMAASVYLHLNEYSDGFLDAHQYSREEINEGMGNLGKEFGVDLGGAEKWI